MDHFTDTTETRLARGQVFRNRVATMRDHGFRMADQGTEATKGFTTIHWDSTYYCLRISVYGKTVARDLDPLNLDEILEARNLA